MKTPKPVSQFPRYEVDAIIGSLDRAGVYSIASDFRGVGYIISNNHIGILAGKNGMLSIEIDDAAQFAAELLDIIELAKNRRRLGIKGA